ncbi:putative alanine racemase-domain-containing protein [Umbelopsis sp. AD052]|nr:putative alanine racemase-domain-containing protein [Umbelopsis sp. AD052]
MTQSTNIVANPLHVLENLFEQSISNGDRPTEFDASKYLEDMLQSDLDLAKIPSLNSSIPATLPTDSLVRFRCMVQDSNLGPEIYLKLHEVSNATNREKKLRCTKYSDADVSAIDQFNEGLIPNEWLDERSVLYCVSPPGESLWMKQQDHSSVDQQLENMSLGEVNHPESDPHSTNKFPLLGVSHSNAVVKLYGADRNIEVGSRIEVIGILSKPSHNSVSEDPMDDFDLPKASFPNTPVIHGIYCRKVNSMDILPVSNDEIGAAKQQACDLRAQLLEYLGNAFGGDVMVAEYVLLQLLSRVTSKRGAFALGQFSVNISEFPSETSAASAQNGNSNPSKFSSANSSTRHISSILQKLVPAFVELPLSLDVLNTTNFYPRSNDENLHAGVLQLLDGTTVLVDETMLKEGTLKEQGVKNMRALNKVIQQQVLGYAYPFHEFDLSTDIGFIVLSRAKSMFPCHCVVPLSQSAGVPLLASDDNGSLKVAENVLSNFRKYIHILKYSDYDIPQAVSEHIQERFVETRKQAASESLPLPTQDDLMLQLNLARLVALSFGSNELTQEFFDYTINLEKMRVSRLEPNTTTEPQK